MGYVLDEIQELMDDYGATYILFSDDSFEDGDPIPAENRRRSTNRRLSTSAS
jgi:hypothetical protein